MRTALVLKSLEDVQKKAKVNCLGLREIQSLEKSAKEASKRLIKLGLDIEFYYGYGSRNGGWGSNSTSLNCTFNKDGTFKQVDISRINSQYTYCYIQINGHYRLTELEKNLLRLHFNCSSDGRINI